MKLKNKYVKKLNNIFKSLCEERGYTCVSKNRINTVSDGDYKCEVSCDIFYEPKSENVKIKLVNPEMEIGDFEMMDIKCFKQNLYMCCISEVFNESGLDYLEWLDLWEN